MSGKSHKGGGLVYSTGMGRMCPSCSQPAAQCRCRQLEAAEPVDGIVRVGRQTKGRKGKGVTLISGLPLDREDLKKLGQQLRRKCCSGGTVKNGTVEIQGDHCDVLIKELTKLGYRVKRTGG